MRGAALLTLLLVTAAAPALADDSAADPELPPLPIVTRTHAPIWIGWQTLVPDVAFIATFASIPGWPSGNVVGYLVALDLLSFAFVSPIIHGVRNDEVGVSVALHVGMPVAGFMTGFLIGAATAPPCPPAAWFCFNGIASGVWGGFAGILFGMGTGALIDAIAFGWSKRPSHVSGGHKSLAWALAPRFLDLGAGVSLVGAF
jgi:hypothetical protein